MFVEKGYNFHNRFQGLSSSSDLLKLCIILSTYFIYERNLKTHIKCFEHK